MGLILSFEFQIQLSNPYFFFDTINTNSNPFYYFHTECIIILHGYKDHNDESQTIFELI